MTDQQLVLQAVGDTRLSEGMHLSRPQMTKQIPSIALAAGMAALSIIAISGAQAKQQCSASAGSDGYWSWRIIDGRKCWYAGKPMLSKTLLEWPARAEPQPAPRAEVASVPAQKSRDLLDAQALAPDDSTTFEALWRARIEKH